MLRAWTPNDFRVIRARDFNWKYLISQLLKFVALLIGLGIWINNTNKHWNDDPTGLSPNVTVAQDGTGHYMTVSDAVAAAPNNSRYQFRIHIKAGVYLENVVVGHYKTNIILVGEGKGRTVVRSGRHSPSGLKHHHVRVGLATLDVAGSGFAAMGMTFENSANPSEGPVIAVRNAGHQSTFFLCSFLGYENTLHAVRGSQFYRECDVYGTSDFIFGDASAIFQRCGLYARKPLQGGHKNVVTSQERAHEMSPSGFVIQRCIIGPGEAILPTSVQTYLGRPGAAFSRVVVIQSYIGVLIHRKGWLGSPSGSEQTVHYREYDNSGPGSFTRWRVNWPGFRVIYNSSEVAKFTVVPFIRGYQWLPSTGVPFMPGLR